MLRNSKSFLLLSLLPRAACLAGFTLPALAQMPVGEPPAPGTYIWVDEHRLHLNCEGTGSPTVVFDSGLGGSSLDWALVQPKVAMFTRACSYDRAGYAWSDPGPLPRNSKRIVDDLEQLLGNASVAAPYLLVGHSLGGMLVQHYARRNPQKTAGLVLVDATHEEQFRRLEADVAPPEVRGRSLMMRGGSWHVPQGLPEDVSLLARGFVARAKSIVVIQSELQFLRSAHRSVLAGALPDVPLVVISHRVTGPAASTRHERWEHMWMDMQLDLATRTPRSRHVIAATADHYVHILEPEIVIDAVRAVVEQHRLEANQRAASYQP
ncbi:MAG: alpha/beta hydrolase [Woeseia sp.]